MSYKLNKPYTEQQKINFIVQYNHNQGLIIEETNKALYALEVNEIMVDGEPTIDPEYEAKQAQAEAERIANLTLTKRVFALALQEYGITYTQLKELIATNEQAQLEWDLCVELERKNPLLDIMALQLGVTSVELDYIFQKANGEDVEPPVKEDEVIEEPVEDTDEQVTEQVEDVGDVPVVQE